MSEEKNKQIGTFEIHAEEDKARTGVLHTAHGSFQTPAFMPVGTQGTVKGITPRQLTETKAEIILTNTYHLHLRPGDERIAKLGGIHRFMGWEGPILSDSGGYQVFSLAKLRDINPDGVVFQSHINGAKVSFTPESVIGIQENLGVDIMMVLDECLPHDASKEQTQGSWKLTKDWAERSLKARTNKSQLIFGIAQGAMFEDLRRQACSELSELPFDGLAIGGLSVGESINLMREMTEVCTEVLPREKVRYLMGVGTPFDLVESVALGIDMFDCVIPTRSARFGRLYLGKSWINIKNKRFRSDPNPIEENCDCYTCSNFSRAYISHLMHAKEMLGAQLASLHNLRFYQRLMEHIRASILQGNFTSFARDFREEWLAQRED